jgi:magnesium chelatase family protein
VRFPASFALVAAMNPCACGYHGSSVRACICDLGALRRYRARLSGPLLDRFDLQVHVPQIAFADLSGTRQGEPSSEVQERVVAARRIQRRRLAGTGHHANAQLRARDLGRWCRLDGPSLADLERVVARRGLSARAVHRLLRVARTLADLDGRTDLERRDVLGATELRALDEELS